MAFKIVISKTVKFKVKGTFKDEAGVDQPFDFTLTCKRLMGDELRDRFSNQSTESLIEFFADVTLGWDGIKDVNGESVPFSRGALGELLGLPGMPLLVVNTYLAEVRVKEKN